MDEPLLQFTITAFVMLTAVINPVAVQYVFNGITGYYDWLIARDPRL